MIKHYEGNEIYKIYFRSGKEVEMTQDELEELQTDSDSYFLFVIENLKIEIEDLSESLGETEEILSALERELSEKNKIISDLEREKE